MAPNIRGMALSISYHHAGPFRWRDAAYFWRQQRSTAKRSYRDELGSILWGIQCREVPTGVEGISLLPDRSMDKTAGGGSIVASER